MTPIDHAWYFGEHVANLHRGPTSRRVPRPHPLDMFWGIDMVGPTLKSTLARSDYQLHLELEGLSYMKTIIPRLIDGAASNFMPTLSIGISFSSAHQVYLICGLSYVALTLTMLLVRSFMSISNSFVQRGLEVGVRLRLPMVWELLVCLLRPLKWFLELL